MKNKIITIGIVLLLLIVGSIGCNEINPFQSGKDKFIGKWSYLGSTAWAFYDDGTCDTPLGKATYEIEGDTLLVEIGSSVYVYEFKFLDDDTKLNLDRGSKAFTLIRE